MGVAVKNRITGWSVAAALLLAAGFAVFRFGTAVSARTLDAAGRSPAVARDSGSSSGDFPEPSIAYASGSSAPAEGYEVLNERQTMLANGDVEHRRLVKRADKYPCRIVVETLHKDLDLKKFVPSGRLEMVADHVLVHLRDGVAQDALEQLASRYNALIVRSLSDERTFIVRLEAPGLDAVDQAVAYFTAAAESIAYAEPDYVRHLSGVPNDTLYGNLWGMPKISAPDAWDITTGSSDSVVAVIDTGMDMDHPDLLANLWINVMEIAGDGVDNDGNGYIDDVNGWDFVTEDQDPEDGDGHGTHCAGTIGAVGNNANQVVGVCWQASIMPVRVGTGQGFMDSDIVDGIRYAARNGAKVLSNSYGGPGFSQTTYDAIDYANDQGCIFVAAAGNEATDNDAFPMYPAGYDLPNVVSVAATDSSDNLATFSNYGANTVDLAAPGVGIFSTYLDGATESLDGTSMACPHVAGAMALLVSESPQVTPAEAKQLAMDSVDEIVGLDGKVVSGGRLNVFAMFANANDADKDGMPDTWEERYGLNPSDALDADWDNDGDFLTNLQEYRNACDPTDADSDDDSLIDGWEVRYGFNPLDVWGTLPKLQFLGYNSDCRDTYDTVVTNGYAYVADGQYGLKILSLSQPEDPELVGTYATAGSARGLAVEGDYAFVADQENGLLIVDVSNPADPALVSSLGTSALKVDVVGSHAYVAASTNGLKIAAISDLNNPSWVGQFNVPDMEAFDVRVVGSTAYLGTDGAMARINVGNPANPQLVSSHINGHDGAGVARAGGSILAALKPFGVVAYDASLNGIGEYETPGEIEDVCYNEGLIYAADGLKGLRILTGQDLANIGPYTSYASIEAYGVTVANGYAYVAGRASGLQVFRSSVDSDEDGMYDGWEIDHFGTLAQSYTDDYDADGIINWGEYLANLDPTSPDQDSDGLIDGTQEVQIYLTDPRTADTDGDGLSDHFEVTTNGTDNVYLTDPLTADTDGDGMTDQWEIDNGLNPLVDDAANDPDGDGATNLEEEQAGTDPNNADTDSDGMPDGWEIDMGLDPLFDDSALNPDGDVFTNLTAYTSLQEYNQRTNAPYFGSTHPLKADSDDDALTDTLEIEVYGTDPNNPDTDSDGMPDGWEINHSLDPLADDAAGDLDGDGLSNYEEYLNGSDPFSADTDGDGFGDDWERDWSTQATNAADPVVVDDNGPFDWWMYGGQPQDPQLSDPDEDGSKAHPFDAIQEAINVAVDGYTILVKEGQYYGFGNRDVNPGSLQLRILAENTNDVSATVVKSHGLGAVFVFEGGQTTNTVLRGFTIQSSMQGIDCSNGDCGEEHGIICRDASSPLIADCVVEICRDSAIYCNFNSSPVLTNVTIRTIYEGHGLFAENGSTPALYDCLISNIVTGCGIYAKDSVGLDVVDTAIVDCNNGTGSGRGIWLVNDDSAEIFNTTIINCQGGIRCDNSSPIIDRCTISGNTAPDYYTVGSAGFMSGFNIAVLADDSESNITDERNAEENGGGILLTSGSWPTIQNCVITDNRTVASDPLYSSGDSIKPYYGLGGGLYSGQNCKIRLVNCTVADNVAMTLGGGFTTFGNYVEHMRNDILWGNSCSNAWLDTEVDPAVLRTPGNSYFNSLHCNEGTSHFDPWYCDISDGGGFVFDRYNFESDPLFIGGGDYHLSTNSPCVDTGTYYDAPLYDRDGIQRPLDGDANTNTYYTVDIGAYEYVNPSADTDGDGTLDIDEIAAGTDPTTMAAALAEFLALYGLSSTGADNDLDGLSNLAEYHAGTNPTNTDTDGDQSPDGDEMIAGTIATDPTSYFYVSDIRPLAEGGCEVVFDTAPGRLYTVYYCTAIGGPWGVLTADEPGDGSPMVVVDPYSESNCFYKAEVRY